MKPPDKQPFLSVELPQNIAPMRVGWQFKDSSTLLAGRYDYHTTELYLLFKNGKEYRYGGVPLELAVGLMDAKSAGKFLHENFLKNNQYRGTLVEPVEKDAK